MKALFAVPVAAVLLTACAGGSARQAEGTPRPAQRDANLISEEEIRASSSRTVHDVIQTLRPAWLRRSRPTAIRPTEEVTSTLLVYVDGNRFGDIATLRQIVPSTVVSIRYLGPAEAQARFGPGHLQGVIEITTRAR